MSINKFNCEGYYDPTAYEALANIEKEERALRAFRPIVYICSPYAGDVTANVENARRYSRFAVDMGYIPIAPHLLFPQFLCDDNPKERQLGLFFGNALMSKCSEVWVRRIHLFRHGSGDPQSQVEELPFEIFYGCVRGGNRLCVN